MTTQTYTTSFLPEQRLVEPPTFTEAREAYNRRVDGLLWAFLHECYENSKAGEAEIAAGNYVMLEDFKKQLGMQ